MFTGLIADLGEVTALDEDGEGATLADRHAAGAASSARATRSPSTASA